jgi:DNA-binding phage protein
VECNPQIMAQDVIAARQLITDFIEKLRLEVERRPHGGMKAVAEELEINRSTLEDWLDPAKTPQPRLETIVRAMQKFKIVLDAGGFVFGQRKRVTPTFKRDKPH